MAESVTLDEAQRWCSEWETTLRSLFGESRTLPAEWEAELSAKRPDTIKAALGRWALLRHFYRVRQEATAAAKPGAPAEVQEVARQLLRREPVSVTLDSGRVVEITPRSYAAMSEIASHWQAIREVEDAVLESKGADLATLRRAYAEVLLHRRAIWAHALTPTGRPAQSLDECPDWWDEITPDDDGRLLAAEFDAGPVRYAKLGPMPEPKGPKREADAKREHFGWGSLFAAIEGEMHLPAASLYDVDLFQLLTWRRAGAADPGPFG